MSYNYLVTIELPAGADFLAAEMGVWLACCVAVPVGPSFPDERKTYIRQHCEAVLNIDSTLLDGINDDDPQEHPRASSIGTAR